MYICTHNETAQFYIGYRENNKLPSDQDLPKYKTSSLIVKPNFNEYNWIIVAEFFNGNDAYDFEQQLIFENWDNPLLINQNCRHNGKRFKASKGKIRSKKHKENLSKSLKGHVRNQTSQERNLRSINQKARGGYGPKNHSPETLSKMSASHKGKPAPWNSKPQTAERIEARAAKLRGFARGPNKKQCEKFTCPHCGKLLASNNYPQHLKKHCKVLYPT